ncbi:putative DeoR family transcriptional regulator [Microlunatus phosphovorus NM-1]|uniref:Putative DeoR family transcriptional regulator n=1 Tax=Microlunatus phosphovorus (strain ATCC 700054 / DSM 10555 / JCM 9379 / NBRC 101784 / NCIMB 13414 / VKM Ac-1990 / NM-1) TaxID=1032480 RepID=F5XS63_MICPN|nr:DeoR/GlpR family DNA-binding transcription regulator [Microlunatus phosphovorus]BAK34744.1 putative DeoR family transcriptional regulator [Microlunatus phosphovorus NM-1]
MTTQVEAAADRHRHIIDRLDAVGRVEVGTLASSLDVAPETIRRDLRLLEQQGVLQRVHGGAVRRTERPLSPFDGTTPEHPPQHLRLAELVIDRLPADATVFIGASPLTWVLAESLSRRPQAEGMTIVTNSLDVAVVMSRVERLHIYNVGGGVEQETRAQQGGWALDEIGRFQIDLALLAPTGVTVEGGIFADTPMAAAIIAAEVRSANQIWLMLEAEKLGLPGFIQAAPIDVVDQILTAGTPQPHQTAPFSDAGITVVSAE